MQEKRMNVTEMLRAYPELETRPKLVAELDGNPPFRRDFMRTVHHIFEMGGANRWVGRYAIESYRREQIPNLIGKWRPIFEERDIVITNEFIGALLNFLTNARLRLGLSDDLAGVPKGTGTRAAKRTASFIRRSWGATI